MREIVGVVANVSRTNLIEGAEPEYYVPFAQATLTAPPFALRVAGDPASYIDTVRSIVAQQDAALPVFSARPYTHLLPLTTPQQRFQAILLSGFAGIALLLSAIGLYAVLGFMVVQRTTELGLRMALGANRGGILLLILRRGLALSVIGLGIGLAASALLTRFLSTLLFATRALDPVTFASMTLLLFAMSTVSCLVPAFRASRLNPIDTLRQQ